MLIETPYCSRPDCVQKFVCANDHCCWSDGEVGTGASGQMVEAKRAVRIGSIFTFVYFLGFTIVMPFLQAHRDALECDALCYGSQTSLRSALSLVGSVIVNRLSDRIGRKPTLWLGIVGSLASLSIGLAIPSLTGMWLGIAKQFSFRK